MSDLESNKRTVVEFYELAFNDKQPEQAVERYVGSRYLQHNPQAPDGPEAFIGFVKAFPGGERRHPPGLRRRRHRRHAQPAEVHA